jgi:hypothetical protein
MIVNKRSRGESWMARRTGVSFRAKQTLLLASKEGKLNVAVELDAFTPDGACDG